MVPARPPRSSMASTRRRLLRLSAALAPPKPPLRAKPPVQTAEKRVGRQCCRYIRHEPAGALLQCTTTSAGWKNGQTPPPATAEEGVRVAVDAKVTLEDGQVVADTKDELGGEPARAIS